MGRMQTVLLFPSSSPTVSLIARPLLNCHTATEHVSISFGNYTDFNRVCWSQENSAPAKLLEIILSSCMCITWQLMHVFGLLLGSAAYPNHIFRGLFFDYLSKLSLCIHHLSWLIFNFNTTDVYTKSCNRKLYKFSFYCKAILQSTLFFFLSIANFILKSLIEICLFFILSPCLLKSALGKYKCSFV